MIELDALNKNFYGIVASQQAIQVTKQISFRAVQNREQGDRATDVIKAVKKRRGMSQIRNAPSLKFSLCEHDNAAHQKASSKDNFTKIRIK